MDAKNAVRNQELDARKIHGENIVPDIFTKSVKPTGAGKAHGSTDKSNGSMSNTSGSGNRSDGSCLWHRSQHTTRWSTPTMRPFFLREGH